MLFHFVPQHRRPPPPFEYLRGVHYYARTPPPQEKCKHLFVKFGVLHLLAKRNTIRFAPCGGGGIRTLDTSVYSYTGFRDRRFQPLSHPSLFIYLYDTALTVFLFLVVLAALYSLSLFSQAIV